jgi:hypothetical protein
MEINDIIINITNKYNDIQNNIYQCVFNDVRQIELVKMNNIIDNIILESTNIKLKEVEQDNIKLIYDIEINNLKNNKDIQELINNINEQKLVINSLRYRYNNVSK